MVPELLPVVGVRLVEGRSGSTLLMQLLGTADEVVFDRRYPSEYRWLSYFARMVDGMAEPFDPERHPGVTEFFFGERPKWGPVPFASDVVPPETLGPGLLRAVWAAWTAAVRERHPRARYYAEKLAIDTDDVVAAGIPLRVIDLVRDPRDALASIRAFSRKGVPGFGRRQGMTETEYLERFVTVVRTGLARVLAAPVAADRVIVRYEDLVSDLAAESARLGEWLGVTLQAGAVEARREEYRHHITAPSVADSVGRWRTDLAADEVAYLGRELGGLAGRLGYEL